MEMGASHPRAWAEAKLCCVLLLCMFAVSLCFAWPKQTRGYRRETGVRDDRCKARPPSGATRVLRDARARRAVSRPPQDLGERHVMTRCAEM